MKQAILVGLALLAGAAMPAHAQSGVPSTPYTAEYGTPVDDLPTAFSHGGSCVRLCEYDFSPCDPDYWKVADRRCNFNQKGSW